MKIQLSKASLLNGVNIVSKAVPTKTTMSILECILIDTSAGNIKLTANDMELGIETIVEGEIFEKGSVALNARIFSDIVRKLPESNVMIETNGEYVTSITCENASFKIAGHPGDDFTLIPVIDRNDSIILSQFTLKEMIRQTIFSIADNDNNKMMNGEMIEIKNNTLRIVALDGHRVALRKIELKNDYEYKKVIVPGKTLNEISKILSGETDKDVSIFFTSKHIMFEFDETVVVSRLIEGDYFRIDQMISNDHEICFSVNKKDLLSCIDRATLLVKEGDKKPIIIDINDQSLNIQMKSSLGSMNESISINKTIGSTLKIGFNPKFLIDVLKVIDEEEIDIYMISSKAPCFIKDKEGSYFYLILPVNFISAE